MSAHYAYIDKNNRKKSSHFVVDRIIAFCQLTVNQSWNRRPGSNRGTTRHL